MTVMMKMLEMIKAKLGMVRIPVEKIQMPWKLKVMEKVRTIRVQNKKF